MRKIFLLTLLLIGFASYSQVKTEYNQYGGIWKRLSLRWNGGLQLPRSAVSTKDLNVATLDTAQLWYNPSDSSIYFNTGFQSMKILNTADTINKWVSGIFRTLGKDSIVFYIGGTRYAIKDSTGSNANFANTDLTFTDTRIHDAAFHPLSIINMTNMKLDVNNGAGIGSAFWIPTANHSLMVTSSATYQTAYLDFQSFSGTGNTFFTLRSQSSVNTLHQLYGTDTSLHFGGNISGVNQLNVYMPNLPSGVGVKSLRVDNNGKLFVADTTSGGGITTLSSVGGGLDIQTGGAGNIRTLNTGEFDQTADLISLKTNGVAYSKLNLSNSIVAGDITSNAITTAKINSNAVDGTKIALGSDAQGDVMYYNGTDWVRLPAGTNGQVLKTQGIGANPIWENISTIANSESWYQYYVDIGGGATANLNINTSGAGAALVRAAMPADGWLLGMEYNTGTTSTGYVYSHSGNSGAIAPISFDSTNRFSYKSIIRFEDTSTSTETFVFQSGFADHHITESSIVDGAWFWYTSTDSSGKFVCKTRSNSTTTAVASSITVMPDTDYILEISEKGGHAYFYINKVQVADISTNVPIGLARATALCHLMKKTNGTTARKLYTQMYAYGKTAN